MKKLRIGLAVVMIGLVAACSDIGDRSARLSLQAEATGVNHITFSWWAYSGATYYRLLVNPDGVSGYSPVGGDISATSVVVAVPAHLTDWLSARYLLEAYDAGGRIASSSSITITSLMLDTIGYAKASNPGSDDGFGYRVALSGDGATLAIAAAGEDSSATGIDNSAIDGSLDSGAVYLFVRAADSWQQQAYVKASNTDPSDAFGSSLALSYNGTTLAIGAVGEDSNATGINGNEVSDIASDAGAVYLFTRSGTAWSQQAYLKASNTGSGDAFGGSVALSSDGNTLAVGAVGEDSSATGIGGSQIADTASDAGAVYLFTRSGTVWSQQTYLKASNTEGGDAFGGSVALGSDGNTLAVGAVGEDSHATGSNGDETSNLAAGSGAVYLLTRSGAVWNQQAYLKASNTDNGDAFGGSLALSSDGNTLAVGAAGEDSSATGIDGNQNFDATAEAGAAYLFVRNPPTWSQQAYIKASNSDAFDGFGAALALSGDGNILAVAAAQEDGAALGIDGDLLDNSAADSGAVYLYSRDAAVWGYRSYVKAPNAEPFDNFGSSVALSSDGNTLLAGADGEDGGSSGIGGALGNNNLRAAGAAYLY